MSRHHFSRARTPLSAWLLCCLLAFLPLLTLQAQGLPGGMYVRGTGGGRGQGPGGMQQGYGAQDRGIITGRVWFLPEEEKGAPKDSTKAVKEVPGAGTVVIVVTSRKDTLFTTVNESGRFRFFNVPTGTAQVRFTMIGYAEEGHPMDITPGENKVVAYLRPEAYQLDAAVKKADVPPVAVDKDTIIFRAAAVKVNKGEMAIDILSQMPGVEVTESGATVLNEEVKRVYVDGALLFGEAPMNALNNLPAEEVIDIRSYQEYANKDPNHKISKNEEKERVLDVRTKTKPKFIFNGDILAGGGFDTDSTYHKFRYTSGVDLHAHSEKLQANFSANINNINNASNRRRGNSFGSVGGGGNPDLRNLTLSANVNKRWMSPTTRNYVLGSVGASYSYADHYNVSESITQLVYFPNEKYDSRVEDHSSWSDATSKAHNFGVNGFKALKDGGIRLSASGSLTENKGHSWSSMYNRQDDLPRQGTSTRSETGSHGKSFSTSFSINKRFRDKVGLSLRAGGSLSDSDNGNLKIDTTTSSISRKVIDINSLGDSHNWNVSPSVSWEIDENRTLTAGVGWSDSFSRTERLAYDISDPLESLMDTVNTYTRTTDNNTRSASLSYRSYLEKIKAVFNLGLHYASVGINKQETFPVEDLYDHRFRSFRPSVNLTTQSMINHWSANYNATASTPSVEEIRPRINNSNLYNVTAGNPDLRQSYSHAFSLSYSTVLGAAMRETVRQMEGGQTLEDLLAAQAGETPRQVPEGQAGTDRSPSANATARPGSHGPAGGEITGVMGRPAGGRGDNGMPQLFNSISTFSTSAKFSLTQSPIVNKRIYYAQDTYLPLYDYTMPAQSTFRTWENAPDGYSAAFSARFDIPIQKIRWFFNTSLSLNWDNNPSYVDEVLTRTQNFRPTLRIGMRSNFSRNVRINLNASGSYIYSYNNLQDKTSYFTERLDAGWEINNIFQHAYLGGNYRKSFTQGVPYAKIDDNIFDLRGGVRFGPRNNVEFSAAVHDLFNKTQGFTTSMSSNYITNKWVHQFGRYVMFSLSYRFNSMRKGSGSKPAAPGGGR